MTDKQIIIDGVDVSRCKYYKNDSAYNDDNDLVDNEGACQATNGYDNYGELCYIGTCKNRDCYYKQLKRKEQECEELKEEFKLFQQLKDKDSFRVVELSTENVKLKHQLDLYKNTHKTEQNRRRAFEQTLAEIKEIAETYLTHCMGSRCDAMDDILQKINEVEDE